MSRWLIRLPLVILVVLVGANVLSAVTASNTVPVTRAGNPSDPVTAEKLKPSECGAMVLSGTVTGTGTFNATAANDLVLAGPAADRPDGRQGDDCVLGGGGNDQLTGGGGADVCIGGPGGDTFTGCETSIQ